MDGWMDGRRHVSTYTGHSDHHLLLFSVHVTRVCIIYPGVSSTLTFNMVWRVQWVEKPFAEWHCGAPCTRLRPFYRTPSGPQRLIPR